MNRLRIVIRVLSYGYWLLLTVLLLVPQPASLVGLRRVPIFPWGKFGIHLSFFVLLSLLVHATRWPKRVSWSLTAVLVAYGMTAESLQLLVPQRSARLMDAIENTLGIVIGLAIYWLVQRTWGNPRDCPLPLERRTDLATACDARP